MALADILDKIKKETEISLQKMTKEFEEKKKKLEEENAKLQKKIDEDLHNKVEENSAKIMEKAETLAEMEAKNKFLEAKRMVIENALEEAVKQLSQSPNYTDIVSSMLKKAELEGDDIEVVPAKGKENETTKALKDSGKNYKLASKSVDISGGFILQGKKIEIDNSFDTIIKKELREDLEITINKLLFA